MHGKGALLATRDLLLRCTQADTSTLEKIKVDDMDCLKDVVHVKRVAVQLDETALCSAISEFGSVQLPDAITHHPSPVIPAKVEEYEDDEHDVLHKSVAGAASGPDTPVRITVQLPCLSNQNWLAQQKEQNFSSADSSKVYILCAYLIKLPLNTKRRCVFIYKAKKKKKKVIGSTLSYC
ncbi:uncharacterized protein [Cherax quadricarinatus]|uniref:uncharacterized protein n=1 Tax=Cherax quadricarinatus TaxID=27406 RepID=UPI00387EC607